MSKILSQLKEMWDAVSDDVNDLASKVEGLAGGKRMKLILIAVIGYAIYRIIKSK